MVSFNQTLDAFQSNHFGAISIGFLYFSWRENSFGDILETSKDCLISAHISRRQKSHYLAACVLISQFGKFSIPASKFYYFKVPN